MAEKKENIDKALQESKKYADDFSSISDVKDYLMFHKEEFIHKWAKVNQYFAYVIKNAEYGSSQNTQAFDVLNSGVEKNPELEEWMDFMMLPLKEKKEEVANLIDIPTFISQAYSYVEEVYKMHSFDTDYVGDLQWKLGEIRKTMLMYKNYFNPESFANLLEEVDTAIKKLQDEEKTISSVAQKATR